MKKYVFRPAEYRFKKKDSSYFGDVFLIEDNGPKGYGEYLLNKIYHIGSPAIYVICDINGKPIDYIESPVDIITWIEKNYESK